MYFTFKGHYLLVSLSFFSVHFCLLTFFFSLERTVLWLWFISLTSCFFTKPNQLSISVYVAWEVQCSTSYYKSYPSPRRAR